MHAGMGLQAEAILPNALALPNAVDIRHLCGIMHHLEQYANFCHQEVISDRHTKLPLHDLSSRSSPSVADAGQLSAHVTD